MNILQNIIFPSVEQFCDNSLYFNCIKGESVYIKDGVNSYLDIKKNSLISFATYYNYFSLNTWLRYCCFSRLKFGIKGNGEVKLFFLSKSHLSPEILINEFSINMSSEKFHSFDIQILDSRRYDSLYLKVESKYGASINSMCFYVDDTPVNDIKMGIVITHFNRKQYVIPAMKRIYNEILSNESFKDKLSLIVVDNSKSITKSECYGSIVIPNDNLGGSGGFTKGLLYLKDNGYSHCLFMDDDASCEIESIKRTFQLLQFAVKEKLAISGSMLYEHSPFTLHEKGAKFKRMILTSLRNGIDVSDFNKIVLIDSYPEKIDYGAWWFFAFKISDLTSYPFPFFVKADDMTFGKMNNFHIISPNGVSVWGEDFGYKDGPLQRYLGTRGIFAASLITNDSSRFLILSIFLKSTMTMLLSYRYSSSMAIYMAMVDFMKGPEYWVDNMNFNDILKSISGCINDEKMDVINLYDYDITHKSLYESRVRKLLRVITLNGLFLPDFMIKDSYVINEKGGRGIFRIIFRSRHVIYFHSPSSKGYVATL
ncbi:TPA: hypothetical protein O7W75_004577, partial [Salmonella enterica]|nr:hypothetical protein [Salmonella enterica]